MDDYPAGPYGLDKGEIIDNFTFMGFRDSGDPYAEISLNDYHDPDGTKGIKALFVTLGYDGCPAAVHLATKMNTWDTSYRSLGLRQLSALHSVLNPVVPNDHTAVESTAKAWIASYATTYDVVIDPTFQLNGGVKPVTDPHSWLIDTRTMRIFWTWGGAPNALLGLGNLLGLNTLRVPG